MVCSEAEVETKEIEDGLAVLSLDDGNGLTYADIVGNRKINEVVTAVEDVACEATDIQNLKFLDSIYDLWWPCSINISEENPSTTTTATTTATATTTRTSDAAEESVIENEDDIEIREALSYLGVPNKTVIAEPVNTTEMEPLTATEPQVDQPTPAINTTTMDCLTEMEKPYTVKRGYFGPLFA